MAAALLSPAHAGTIIKANNSDSLNLPSSWADGVAPGSDDIIRWDSTVTSARTVSLGNDQTWRGFNIVDPGGSVTLSAGNLLTLGSDGIESTPNLTITLNNSIRLGNAQTWNIAANSLILAGGVNTAGFTLTLNGAGTKQFKKNITGSGAILVKGGTMKLSTGSTAGDSAVTAHAGTTLAYDTATGSAPAARTGSVTLHGGTLTAGGLGTANTTETNAGALTIGPGKSTVTITPNSTRNTRLASGSFVRHPGGIVLFRGSNLGMNPAAAAEANSANVVFAETPTLAASTNHGIIAGAYGDTTTTGNGTGLMTYDSSNGIRLLDSATEYNPSITDGQTQPDNVLLANNSGTPLAGTINSVTTLNSLSFRVGDSAGSGISIGGTGSLKLNSGVIWGQQAIAAASAADSMIISGVTLDLNGKEGIFIFNTLNTGSGGTGGGPLVIESGITNDGGNGITFGGSGLAKLSGSAESTYTGVTTHLSGNLWLKKSGINAIPGNLVIHGGAVINSSHQIPDTADITINGGSLAQKASLNSGSGASETFRDLFMTGGGYSDGSSGTSSGSTFLRNAGLTGGTWSVSGGHKTTLSGSLDLAGGQVKISAGSSSSHTTILTTQNGFTIANTPSGSYTPITLNSSSTNTVAGARLVLAGEVAFLANSANENTVTIDSPVPVDTGNSGNIALSGIRTFDVGDGPAADDLTIAAPLVDAASTGGLTKTGAGTLALARTNSYSGPTTVNAGTLRISGAFAGDVTVNGAGIEFQNDLFANGSLAINGPSRVILGQTVSFDGVNILADELAPGIYSHAYLAAAYPGLFDGSFLNSAIINRGATWHLSEDQSAGSDWNSLPGTAWAINPDGTGTNPFTINPYDSFNTNGHLLRTAETSSVFGGGVLELNAGSTLSLQTTTGETSTIPDLNITGGTITGLAGAGAIQNLVINHFTNSSGTTTLSAAAGNEIHLTVDVMSGAGNLDLTGGGTFHPDFTDARDYTGTITLSDGSIHFELPASGNPFSSGGGLVVNTGATLILNEWAYFTGLAIGGNIMPAGTYPAAALDFSGTGGIVVYQRDTTGPPQMFGVNLAGAEFGNSVPGTYGSDYTYPTDAEMAYYESKGLRLIRLPFKWERLQRALNGPLHAAELARIDAVVGYARNRGMKVLLDMHNYNKYSISGTSYQVGSVEVPYSTLQDVWSRLAEHYKNNTGIYGYDIMNEPGGTLENWNAAAQATVHAIRLSDTSHYVFIEGVNWSGAQSWLGSNFDLKVVDPVDRVIYSAHSYWDKGYQNWSTNWKFDGTYASYTQEGGYPEMGADLISDFIGWLKERGYHGHIGEFGVPKNDARWNVVLDKALGAMQSAGLSGTYWAGGPWWGTYPISCEPAGDFTVDAPQMSVLQNYTGATFDSWRSFFFTPTQLADPSTSGPLASPIGSGVSNLLSYASGVNPTLAGIQSALPRATLENGNLTLTYIRNKSAGDIILVAEVSGDLQTWNSGPAYTSSPLVIDDDGFLQTIQVKDLVPSTSGAPRYIRLRITNP